MNEEEKFEYNILSKLNYCILHEKYSKLIELIYNTITKKDLNAKLMKKIDPIGDIGYKSYIIGSFPFQYKIFFDERLILNIILKTKPIISDYDLNSFRDDMNDFLSIWTFIQKLKNKNCVFGITFIFNDDPSIFINYFDIKDKINLDESRIELIMFSSSIGYMKYREEKLKDII